MECMSETQTPQNDTSKTFVAFVAGLLLGGIIVWMFSGPSDNKDHMDDDHKDDVVMMDESATATDSEINDATDANDEAPAAALPQGDGSVAVSDQPASDLIAIDRVVYPIAEGWIGVRDYNDGQLGFIKGVIRFSASAGIAPEAIPLQLGTVAGDTYAVVMFKDNGDAVFSPAGDVQLPDIYSTFTATAK